MRKNGIFWDISFLWDYILEKENTHYSTLLSLTRITFQNKEKYSTQYNYSILQLEYFFLTNFTATRVCMHTSWLFEKPAAARSARGYDKVQTCYSHQGNNDTRILGEKFQQFLATQKQATPRAWHNWMQPIDREPASLDYARE